MVLENRAVTEGLGVYSQTTISMVGTVHSYDLRQLDRIDDGLENQAAAKIFRRIPRFPSSHHVFRVQHNFTMVDSQLPCLLSCEHRIHASWFPDRC